ncbi:hypothetical protein ACFVW8_07715 [Streptomyces sp. NPDC058221]|uniref:hypothetical protein n=1 Tax=Streptomyces sp. NPDC058221 TaxID=3346388 RepID=UPI0036E8B6E6
MATADRLNRPPAGPPGPGWPACRINTRHVAGGFHQEGRDIRDSRGSLVARSRQLAILQWLSGRSVLRGGARRRSPEAVPPVRGSPCRDRGRPGSPARRGAGAEC